MNTPEMNQKHGDICPYNPWTLAMLDNLPRKILQNPDSMIGRYILPGMTVMDIGCGPGFFTLAMARLAGEKGKVIAIDVQREMLDLVEQKSMKLNLLDRIRFHQSLPDSIGIKEQADFILSFYMVHEVPDCDLFFHEVSGLLAEEGRYLVVEPRFHVPADAFEDTLLSASRSGFRVAERPRVFLSRAAVLVKQSG